MIEIRVDRDDAGYFMDVEAGGKYLHRVYSHRQCLLQGLDEIFEEH